MIKKLLNTIIGTFSYEYDRRNSIEQYLAESKDLADLEHRMRELDQKGTYYRLHL